MNTTINKLRKLGYIVRIDPTTAIYEPFTSNITGEQYLKEISYSTKENNIQFLRECLEELVKYNNSKK